MRLGWKWHWAGLGLLLLLLFGGVPRPAGAFQEGRRAALVVDLGDGRVIARVVSFSEESISGEELLRRSGLNVALTGGLGAGVALCAVEDVGCPPTPQDCFCQCRGTDCTYWNYYHLQDGQWTYAPVGASSHRLGDGDVDAWVWGDGQTPPPLLSWDDILALAARPAEPAPTEPPPPTELPPPTATPVPPSPTSTPQPSATIPPTHASTPVHTASQTPQPSATPAPTATGAATAPHPATPPPTPTPEPAAASGTGLPSLLGFGGLVLLLLLLWWWVRRRR